MWTYVSLPFVLADWGAEELPGRRLRFRVPEPIRSHCREQTIHLDDGGLIVRHEYVAEAFGPWARGVHRSSAFRPSTASRSRHAAAFASAASAPWS